LYGIPSSNSREAFSGRAQRKKEMSRELSQYATIFARWGGPSQEVKVALLGASGSVGWKSLAAVSGMPNAKIVAVVGRNRERLEKALREDTLPGFDKSKVQIYAGEKGFETMLRNEEIQAVISATPSKVHTQQGMAIAEAGKNLLIEKPLALSIPECDILIDAFRRADKQLGVIFQLRYNPEIRALKRLIQQGNFGEIGMGHILVQKGRDQRYWTKKEWFGIQAEGGDAVSNQSIHQLDNMLYLVRFEKIASVFALCQILDRKRPVADPSWRSKDATDSAAALFKLNNGGSITAHMSTAENKHAEHKDNIQSISLTSTGSNNYIKLGGEKTDQFEVINLEEIWYKAYYDEDGEVRFLPEKETPPATWRRKGLPDPYLLFSHYREIAEFLDCVARDRRFPLDGIEAKKSLSLVIAIYESAVNQQEIRLADVFENKVGRSVQDYLL
jgi:predicted dehydrogenase